MGATLARILLWVLLVLAWALVVIFGAAVFFGGDLLTRVVGLVIALVSLAAALGLQRTMRRFRHARPPSDTPPPEPLRPPADLDEGDFTFPGLGHFKDRTALHLDHEGFDALHLGKKTRRYSWGDVEDFRVVSLSIGGGIYGRIPTVGVRLRGRGHSLGDRIGRWGTGADVLLPTVAMAPDDLAKLLEGYRRRYSPVFYAES